MHVARSRIFRLGETEGGGGFRCPPQIQRALAMDGNFPWSVEQLAVGQTRCAGC